MTSLGSNTRNSALRWPVRVASALHERLWWNRAVTLGVRAMVFDAADRVLLIRHSYAPGWHFPGGGVDPGETTEAAAIRELREEAGLLCLDRPALHGIFFNQRLRRDYVACYVMRRYEPVAAPRHDWEIAESGFFPLAALPEGTTPATLRRLGERLDGMALSHYW